jgi:septal ring factor EnvC (AmiA/AmiB activator)
MKRFLYFIILLFFSCNSNQQKEKKYNPLEEFNEKIENSEKSIKDRIKKTDKLFNKIEKLKFDSLSLDDYLKDSSSHEVIILKYD